MVTAYIGLGSNLEDPPRQLRRAIEALRGLPKTRLGAVSSHYRSPAIGPAGQPDYVNAVVELTTALEPELLLTHLQAIEAAQGRVRGERWGPRTIDLDLLLYGEQHIHIDGLLDVPHPAIAERAFVLLPLAEIAAEQSVPGQGRVRDLLVQCDTGGVVRIDSP